jgi:hypothetical protein
MLSNIAIRIAIHHENDCLDNGLFFECEVFIYYYYLGTSGLEQSQSFKFFRGISYHCQKRFLFSRRSLVCDFHILYQ